MTSNVHTLDRRAILTGTAATAAALAATTIPAEPSVSPLLELIEAHKRANAEWLEWVDRESREHNAVSKMDRAEPILAEVSPGHHLEIHADTDLGAEIWKRHDETRQRIGNLRLRPDIENAALASIDEAEAEARKRCAAALRQWKQRREESGYAATKRAYDLALAADRKAALAVVAYPCRSLEENRIRAEYLLGEGRDWPGKDIRYTMEADRTFLEAFIRSTPGAACGATDQVDNFAT